MSDYFKSAKSKLNTPRTDLSEKIAQPPTLKRNIQFRKSDLPERGSISGLVKRIINCVKERQLLREKEANFCPFFPFVILTASWKIALAPLNLQVRKEEGKQGNRDQLFFRQTASISNFEIFTVSNHDINPQTLTWTTGSICCLSLSSNIAKASQEQF